MLLIRRSAEKIVFITTTLDAGPMAEARVPAFRRVVRCPPCSPERRIEVEKSLAMNGAALPNKSISKLARTPDLGIAVAEIPIFAEAFRPIEIVNCCHHCDGIFVANIVIHYPASGLLAQDIC